MHVRWERRPLDSSRRKGFLLEAILVRAIEGSGAHREEIEDILASVEERFLKINEAGVRAFHEGIFWATVDRKLDALHIQGEKRRKIEEEVFQVVKRPRPEWSLWCVKCIPEYDDA